MAGALPLSSRQLTPLLPRSLTPSHKFSLFLSLSLSSSRMSTRSYTVAHSSFSEIFIVQPPAAASASASASVHSSNNDSGGGDSVHFPAPFFLPEKHVVHREGGEVRCRPCNELQEVPSALAFAQKQCAVLLNSRRVFELRHPEPELESRSREGRGSMHASSSLAIFQP